MARIASAADGIAPLPAGMRSALLHVLAIAYPKNAAQRRLGNAPDAAIAWTVQSALDDFADFTALEAFGSLVQ